MQPGGAGDHDVAVTAHRAQEALELEFERLRFGRLELHVLHDLFDLIRAEVLPARFQLVEIAVALREIEREVPRRLEDAQLAGALPRHPARGDDRDGAVGELDTRVRDVHVRREDRHARRPHLADLRPHELQNEIEIVNHEVEDDRDVGAARLERRQALGLQETRLLQIWCRGAHRSIESLDVAYLEAQAALPGYLHELLGTGQRVGQRLLDQRVEIALEHRQPHLHVRRGRDDHGDRLDAVQQRRE